jgi:TolA-binding protein
MVMKNSFSKILFIIVLPVFMVLLGGCGERKAKKEYKVAEELFKGGSYKDAAGKYAEVIKYEKAIPEVEDSYYKLGVIYAKYLEDPTSAVFYLEQLVQKFPGASKIPDAKKDIGQNYLYKLNKPDKAVEQFEFVEKNYPKSPFLDEVTYLKGKAYIALNQPDNAAKAYDNFVLIFPNSKYLEEVEYQRGLIKLNAGKYKEAGELYRGFLAKYPKSTFASLAKFDLGNSYENLGDYKNALETYKTVGPDYPNQDALKLKIQKIEERLKKKNKAAVTRTPASVKKSRDKAKDIQYKKKSKKTKKKKTPVQ